MKSSPETPTARELANFRERYGIEALVLWSCAFVEMPAWVLMNLLRIGRHFGSLPEDRYDNKALAELIRRPYCTANLKTIIRRSQAGEYISLQMIREMRWIGGQP